MRGNVATTHAARVAWWPIGTGILPTAGLLGTIPSRDSCLISRHGGYVTRLQQQEVEPHLGMKFHQLNKHEGTATPERAKGACLTWTGKSLSQRLGSRDCDETSTTPSAITGGPS